MTTKRIDVIGQNGNDGEHYEEEHPPPLEDTTANDVYTDELLKQLNDAEGEVDV